MCCIEMSKNRWNVSFSSQLSGWWSNVRVVLGVDLFLMWVLPRSWWWVDSLVGKPVLWNVVMVMTAKGMPYSKLGMLRWRSDVGLAWLVGYGMGLWWQLQKECLVVRWVYRSDSSGLLRWCQIGVASMSIR